MRSEMRWKTEFLVHRASVRQKMDELLENPAANTMVTRKARILLVDDNPVVQAYIKYQFEQLGCDLFIASNAEEAFKLYHPSIDLALVDLNLPDLPGVTVANWIRRQEQDTGQRIPIIGHTGCVDEETEYRCFVSGMDHAVQTLKTREECQALLRVWLPDFMKIN